MNEEAVWSESDEIDLRESSEYPEFFMPKPWVIEGIVPEGLTFLYGERETGKSFVALDMAFAVAAGQPWLGKFETRPSDVVYIFAEDPSEHRIGAVRRKYAKWLRQDWTDKSGPQRDVAIIEAALDLTNPRVIKLLQDTAKKLDLKPRFFIIDTLAATFQNSEENTYKDTEKYIRAVRTLVDDFHASALIITHPARGTKHERGHTNFGNGASAVLALRRLSKRDPMNPDAEKRVTLKLESEKIRHAAPFGPVFLDRVEVALPAKPLQQVNAWREKAGMTVLAELPLITTCVIEPATATSEALRSERTTSKAKKAHERDPKALEALASLATSGATDSEWREAARSQGVRGGTFDRAKDSLLARRLVNKEGNRFVLVSSSLPAAA
jgi:hypothetical protein